MNKLTKKMGILLIPFASILPFHSSADTIVGDAQIFLLEGLGLTSTRALDFGVILPPTDGDQVTVGYLTATPTISSANGNSVLSGSYTRGAFDITGTPNTTAIVQVSESITLTGPGDPMTVNSFEVNRGAPLIEPSGSTEIIVGATLNINANQAPGNYTGTYAVTVAYL